MNNSQKDTEFHLPKYGTPMYYFYKTVSIGACYLYACARFLFNIKPKYPTQVTLPLEEFVNFYFHDKQFSNVTIDQKISTAQDDIMLYIIGDYVDFALKKGVYSKKCLEKPRIVSRLEPFEKHDFLENHIHTYLASKKTIDEFLLERNTSS